MGALAGRQGRGRPARAHRHAHRRQPADPRIMASTRCWSGWWSVAAGLRPGDGLFGLHRAARQPEVRALHAHLLPDAPPAGDVRRPSLAALVVVQVPMKFWERATPWLLRGLSLVLLVVVLMPGHRQGVNGARRWLPLGRMNFQPSELAKLAIALYAASYMVRKMDVKENFFQRRSADGGGGGPGRLAAAGRARHGRLHGDRHDRDGHPVPGRRQRAHVRLVAAGAGGGLRADDRWTSEFRASASLPTWTPGTRSTRRARATS
jgi:hypothetical protein